MTSLSKEMVAVETEAIYRFGAGESVPELNALILGGKGLGLAQMAATGLRVPPGFIITTDVCRAYHQQGALPAGVEAQIDQSIAWLEQKTGHRFADAQSPLILSIRSGAPISMPGMMDSILNLGLNDQSVEGLSKRLGAQFAYDSYRRFLQLYSEVVHGADPHLFEQALAEVKKEDRVELDHQLSVQALQRTCQLFKQIHREQTGNDFPQDPHQQLTEAIQAVFRSWNSERATAYRAFHHISDDLGTAVIVQAMVFGNLNDRSATGVLFTRDPATGENRLYGEFLIQAQGEDVVAGTRTPQKIDQLDPKIYRELETVSELLERTYRDAQDIEFTVEDGVLYILQTRAAKRTGLAAMRMAVEMIEEGLINGAMAIHRVAPEQLLQLLAPVFSLHDKEAAKGQCVAHGLNAGPGAASGVAVLSWQRAVEWARQGKQVILIRDETSAHDFPGMAAAVAILTARGGATSHAAVVARGMGKPCVAGCKQLHIDAHKGTISCAGKELREGDPISIDGTTGEVFFTHLKTSPSPIIRILVDGEQPQTEEESRLIYYYQALMNLADQYRTLQVRSNADTPRDAHVTRALGGEGIGLCRTEHMFFSPKRLLDVRRMFLSLQPAQRHEAIQRLLPHQKGDFIAIFQAMQGLPVTVRLLDPPLHEFLPRTDPEMAELAQAMGTTPDQIRTTVDALREQNPMLGHRGCRLGILYPEVTAMQVRALFEAALEVLAEGTLIQLEIMVPLTGIATELHHQKLIIDQTASQVFAQYNRSIPYLVGTMIELPRACLIASTLAQEAQFFSFGTNDLTQTTFGISRDDSGVFLPNYITGVPDPIHPDQKLQILPYDPFQVLDPDGVGALMRLAITNGRATRPSLKCGICGEHGGEAHSIRFCQGLGLDYVSCSPYRLPLARLAAAQATSSMG